MNGSDPKQSARELLEEAHPALVGLSHWIHANPETGFQETLASGWVAEWLMSAGFDVEVGAAGMPTAVIGSTGPGPFHVVICAEYDALPAVGHACGHNIIAAAGVGAGLALASVADELGLRVTVMGTPAEEGGGGKIRLIDAGAFEGVHAALMVHPWPADIAEPSVIAVRTLEITYVGREAHAAGYPQLGVNAADALVVAQTAIGLLRQHLLPTDRVHGIVTKGGDAPNIIPAHTTAEFMVRATSRERLDILTEKVRRCFEAGALATGADVAIAEDVTYSDMVHDSDLAALYQANAESLGRVFELGAGSPVSTDMGDVSYVVPSIHPMISVESNGAVNHQPGFTDACATPSADQAVLDGALGMAWTVIDAALDARLRARLMGQAMVTEAIELAVEADVLDEVSDTLAVEAAVLADRADQDIAEAADLDARAHELADEDGGVTDEVMLLEASAQMLGDRAEAEAEAADELGLASDAMADEAEARAETADELVAGAVDLQVEALEGDSSNVSNNDDEWLASPAEAAWQGEDGVPAEAVADDAMTAEAVAEDGAEPVAVAAATYLAYDAFADPEAEAPTEFSGYEAPVEAVAEDVAEGEPTAEAAAEFSGYDAVAETGAESEFVPGAPAWLSAYDAPVEAGAGVEAVADAEPVADAVAEFSGYDEPLAEAPAEFVAYDTVAEPEPEPETGAVAEASADAQPEAVEFVGFDAVEPKPEPEPEAEPVAVAEVVSEGNDLYEESSQPAAVASSDDWQVSETPAAADLADATADEPTFVDYENAQQPDAEPDAEPEAVAAPAQGQADEPVSAHDSWEAEFEAAMAALAVTPDAEQSAETPVEQPTEAVVAEASGEAADAAAWTVPSEAPLPTVGDFEWIAAGPESGSDELART